MSIFAPGLVNLWNTIESCGIDPEPLFAVEHTSIQLPIDPSLRFPYEVLDRIRATAVEMCGEETFGLRSASVYVPSQLGALGYAWLASPTLRKAFLRVERFIRVVTDDASVLIEDRDGCMVVTLKLDVHSECESVRDDGALALITRMCRLDMGDHFRLQAVNFKHAEPKDIKPYFEYFGCQLNFNQAENQLLIPLSIADEALVGADSELTLLNDNIVTRSLARIDRNDIVARVQAALVDQLSHGDVSGDSVAEALHMSVRTLHRKLADVNSNFKAQLVETRRRLADHYILDNNLTLTEISLLLGFSEASSFSRAFKTWTGSTPTQMRKAGAV
jgi:AraC-like DNA-binding protein